MKQRFEYKVVVLTREHEEITDLLNFWAKDGWQFRQMSMADYFIVLERPVHHESK